MTRKLTDEQVTAIKKLSSKGSSCFVEIETPNTPDFIIQTIECINDPNTYWQVFPTALSIDVKKFKTADEAIAYAEHLLNQRYCWLPKNNGWIMSGEIIKFKDAGKVLELMHLAYADDWDEREDVWYSTESTLNGIVTKTKQIGMPTSQQWSKGVTIYPESPIWDAVKGVKL
jgi:hypothetical protein